MARDTSGGQQHRQGKREDDVEVEETTESSEELRERQESIEEDVDTILDEIDEVLEENAEDFVRSFVQKGGQ